MKKSALAEATEIYFSTTSITIYYVVGVCLFGVGIYVAIQKLWLGYLLLIFGIIAVMHAYNISKQNEVPYLLLNNHGIKPSDKPIIPWKNIDAAQVLLGGVGGRYHKWHLKLKIKASDDLAQDMNIDLKDLTLSPKEIEALILQYQAKANK